MFNFLLPFRQQITGGQVGTGEVSRSYERSKGVSKGQVRSGDLKRGREVKRSHEGPNGVTRSQAVPVEIQLRF